MARKNRVEIFFVLYLTALVGFVVVSKERDKHDLEIEQQKNSFLRSFLRPVSLEFSGDTLWWYVDAPEGAKTFRAPGKPLLASLRIHDIGSSDSVAVQVKSVTHNNLLVAPRLVQPMGRKVFGDLRDRMVSFPVACKFNAVGVYTVSLAVHTRRFHQTGDGSYRYRDMTFPQDLLPKGVVENIESTQGTFVVVVEDTSIAKPVDVADLVIKSERTTIQTAYGYTETNTLNANLGFYNPRVRIVEGPGAIERDSGDSRNVTYTWSGTVSRYPYDVVVEARVGRKAGGKDIARTSFRVVPELPFMTAPNPEFAYSGETFVADVAVQGLDEPDAYSWELFETAGLGGLLSKLSGTGTQVRYHVPTGFAGKNLVVRARYRGKPYLRLDKESGRESSSRFVFPVIDPPVHIDLTAPEVLRTSDVYRFTAYKYSQMQYRFDQPVMNLDAVDVRLSTDEGTDILTNVRMNSPGRFEFAFVYPGDIPENGVQAALIIAINDAVLRRSVTLRK